MRSVPEPKFARRQAGRSAKKGHVRVGALCAPITPTLSCASRRVFFKFLNMTLPITMIIPN